jgi:predicted transposase/invertase (TIGR01784 family)
MFPHVQNLQDFEEDKLSVLDVKAVDRAGAIYDVEMQLETLLGLVKRCVFYGCELYAGQLKAGQDYTALCPVYSIFLIHGVLWPDATRVHHAFRLTDEASGRVLQGTLELHTLELARYNLAREMDLAGADMLDRWLYWLLHAQDYEPAALLELFPEPAIRQATETLIRISQITEDKAMYDAREKLIRDRQWAFNAAKLEGEIEGEARGEAKGEIKGRMEGEIKLIRTLQGLLNLPVSAEQDLRGMTLEQLEALTSGLQERLRNRPSS